MKIPMIYDAYTLDRWMWRESQPNAKYTPKRSTVIKNKTRKSKKNKRRRR